MDSIGDQIGRSAWKAELGLSFRKAGERSVLAERRHHGPLVVQKPLYPEGPDICHAVILHPPGGIAGGDELVMTIRVEAGARLLLTTPAAGKWYKANGRISRQTARFEIAGHGTLEWLPQETIIYDAAESLFETEIDLGEKSVFAGWEITCLGRRASGETFREGGLRQTLCIRRGGRLLWDERLALRAGDRLMTSPVGLAGHHVFGSMVIAAGTLAPDLLAECRTARPRAGACGVTALPEILAARYVGDSAEHAIDYFESLRRLLRPWYADRPALRPRLWNT